MRLAWLPADEYVSPEFARALNQRLESVKVAGVTTQIKAPVSMEVAQLSLECIEASSRCFGTVGSSLSANRLLWVDIDKKGDQALVAAIVLYDVDGGRIVRRTERTFATAGEALAGVDGFVQAALNEKDAAAPDAHAVNAR